ncbi:poly(R)-hydroxyalkanoic acid synthase subunit PhaE [Pontibacterium sp.]|uniref:poly(R)-hydroxyalkanoic acid synthase subunit PhaE n=1 Tax=Pontibacterium sp. TaxID=2036026 RepID=UPI003512D363
MSDNLNQQMNDWLEAQKAYWQALGESADELKNPEGWQEFIKRYQSTAGEALPLQFSQLMDVLSAQSHNFNEYGEELIRHFRNSGSEQQIESAVSEFQNYMQKQTTDLLMRQWQLPEQVAALFKTHSFHDDLLFENPFISGVKSLLETPVVGSNPELQANSREAIRLLLEYQEALSDYIRHYSEINQEAGRRMTHQLAERDGGIDTLRELHNVWVECYESAYSDTVFTDDYQQAHGRISNALMSLRNFSQNIRDIYFQSAGLATRKGLDTALQRQHQLRKEMRQARRQISALNDSVAEIQNQALVDLIQDMRSEITSLKKEVAALKKKVKE